MLRELQQPSDAIRKFRRQHVVGIVAKRIIAQSGIRRIIANLLALPTQFFHPDVGDVVLRQLDFQRLPIEVRHPARHGERANVDQRADAVSLQRSDKFVERARGMTDSVDGGHYSVEMGGARLTGVQQK